MSRDKSCCGVCSRGLYSCHWTKSSTNNKNHACLWFLVVTVLTLLSLCWLYTSLVMFNDRDDVNCKLFTILKHWVNWFMVVIIISAVLSSYCVLLLMFALIQVVLGEKLDLHSLHKFFLFLGVIFVASVVIGISVKWPQEWPTVPLSLQATAPFLQFGAVVALTLLSPFVFRGFHVATKGSKFLIAVVFLLVAAAIFLSPLLIQSPCLIDLENLPEKPKLIGHRGAPMLAPENTMMSFNKSIECGVTAFETDVQLSKDRIPFLMHDHESEFLLRTTDAQQFFNQTFTHSNNLTWEELMHLNAGEWFLEKDPYHTVSLLSDEEKTNAKDQTIPSLHQLLDLAKQHSVSVIFDIYNTTDNDNNDAVDIVKTISDSGINPRLILWLPPQGREYVNMKFPGFVQVYSSKSQMHAKNGSHLNVKYSALSTNEIRELRRENVTVNLWVVNERWLFSLLWCAGASSVTTNSCHLLKDVAQPDWVLAPHKYKTIWILVDIASVVTMIGLYILGRKSRCFGQTEEIHRNGTEAWNERELSPFLST
ncbi:glycerophosphoinositol inositolphosphodiesterase GDPD2 [Parambassis ranga]|uniref:Glycerophosphoinositol inositolphosphodiesterase GDPD2 n=1 Tax=Parambassis ranga TaxID=210632 RepID=A0A6P7J8I8_9TELE|nr:glycerophosphoinositol inositolphosphodiesterase GDPD2 [Parambassis ranga]XP_028272562.1 glycerophosphoinositol inositolphosphodiesterase GDPD2 [Parambassis ranga]